MIWVYLTFGVVVLALCIHYSPASETKRRRERACDRSRYTNNREALFIREVGDDYVTSCFGPALPI